LGEPSFDARQGLLIQRRKIEEMPAIVAVVFQIPLQLLDLILREIMHGRDHEHNARIGGDLLGQRRDLDHLVPILLQ